MAAFQDLLAHAEKTRQDEPSLRDYWDGYIRGLHRGHYGYDVGLGEEHEWQVEESEQYARRTALCRQMAARPARGERAAGVSGDEDAGIDFSIPLVPAGA